MTNQNESATVVFYYTFSTNTISGFGGTFTSMSYAKCILPDGWVRLVLIGTSPSSGTVAVGLFPRVAGIGSVYLWGAQLENVTNQTNKNLSEYVSKGTLSAPYHGANIDGIKYFDYENGNYLSGTNLIERRGRDIFDYSSKFIDFENVTRVVNSTEIIVQGARRVWNLGSWAVYHGGVTVTGGQLDPFGGIMATKVDVTNATTGVYNSGFFKCWSFSHNECVA